VDVVKPSVSSYIRVYSAQTKLQVYSLDTAAVSSNIQFLTSKNMSFTIPIGSLTNDSYYILFDWGINEFFYFKFKFFIICIIINKGVAVYNQYCKPLTYPITNTSLWIFTVVTFTSSTTSTTTNTNTTPTLSTNTSTPSNSTTSTTNTIPNNSTSTSTTTTIIIVSTVTTNNTSVLLGLGAFLVLAGLIGSAIIWVNSR